MSWEIISTIIGTILGSQAVAEIVRWIKNRKMPLSDIASEFFVPEDMDTSIEEAHADSEEFNSLRETIQFLQEQLKGKEERFAEQTNIVRNLNTEVIQLTREKADVELAYARYKADTELELEKVRCEDKPCPWRRPPNAYTEPKPQGKTKEDYHNEKN